MNLSIIIPTFNESAYIGRLLDRLISAGGEEVEIIVVDGGSTDGTVSIVKESKVRLIETAPSRSKQMNIGAKEAKADRLYFVHADTYPPASFLSDIAKAFEDGSEACCYRTQFEKSRALMKLNEFLSRYHKLYFRGGDQSLAISKVLFNELGTYNEEMAIMEEYPLLEQLMSRGKFKVIPKDILISSRKYRNNSWLNVTRANLKAYRMFKNGKDTKEIKEVYCRRLQLNS